MIGQADHVLGRLLCNGTQRDAGLFCLDDPRRLATNEQEVVGVPIGQLELTNRNTLGRVSVELRIVLNDPPCRSEALVYRLPGAHLRAAVVSWHLMPRPEVQPPTRS